MGVGRRLEAVVVAVVAGAVAVVGAVVVAGVAGVVGAEAAVIFADIAIAVAADAVISDITLKPIRREHFLFVFYTL